MLILIEIALALIAAALALVRPNWRWLDAAEQAFAKLAHRRWASVVLAGLAALALRATLLPILPVPQPAYHDDFCYLLEGDTFAHGRATNPTHPMWVHFETFDIIPRPTRQCVTPPAQGVALALGKILLGHPFWGVWLTIGLMCAAICWMLHGWMSPPWALAGALIANLRYGTFGYWSNTYWGGAVGAIGGALVLGALPRIKRSCQIKDALLMGLGLDIMAGSRPYEGFVLAVPVILALMIWMIKGERPTLATVAHRVVLPLCLLLGTGALGLGYYYWRVTGSPFRMPYHVVQETYGVAPYFTFQPLRPIPQFHHQLMRDMYANRLPQMYAFSRSLPGRLEKPIEMWSFFVGPIFTLPLLMLVFVLPYGFSWNDISKSTRFLLLTFGLSMIAVELETYYSPHYSGPLTSLILALILLPMRKLRNWQPAGRPGGLFLTRAVVVICAITFALRAAAGPLGIHIAEAAAPAWYQTTMKSAGRPAILEELQRLPGRHLVLVRYDPDRIPFEEWVYNDADIDNARVIWAREMGPAENAELMNYFRERKVWLVEADKKPPRLSRVQQSAALSQ